MVLLNPLLWLAVLAITLIGGELARSIVDKGRVERRGFGGAGDIALIQAIVGYLVIAMLLACLCYRAFW